MQISDKQTEQAQAQEITSEK